MSATHDVLIPDPKESRFHVDMKLWNLDQMMISAGNFSGQIFTRKFEHIRRDHIDHYLFFVQGAGQRIVQSADFFSLCQAMSRSWRWRVQACLLRLTPPAIPFTYRETS